MRELMGRVCDHTACWIIGLSSSSYLVFLAISASFTRDVLYIYIYLTRLDLSSPFPFPSLVVELSVHSNQIATGVSCHLSQPDWRTKSFSFFQLSQLGYWAFSAFKPVRDWFCLPSLSSQVGQLILSVRFPQCGYWTFQRVRPVRDRFVCDFAVATLRDKIFLLFQSPQFGCQAFSAYKPDRDCFVCHLLVAILGDYFFLFVFQPG